MLHNRNLFFYLGLSGCCLFVLSQIFLNGSSGGIRGSALKEELELCQNSYMFEKTFYSSVFKQIKNYIKNNECQKILDFISQIE